MDFPSTLRIVPMRIDGVQIIEDMPAMLLISKVVAPDRPLLRAKKSYELQFWHFAMNSLEFRCFFLPSMLLSGYPLLSCVYNYRPVRTSPPNNS